MLRCLAVALMLSTAAFAQVKKDEPAKKAPPKTEVIFGDGSEIDGTRDAPLGTLVETTVRPGFSGLIKVRENFNDKLAESVFEL